MSAEDDRAERFRRRFGAAAPGGFSPQSMGADATLDVGGPAARLDAAVDQLRLLLDGARAKLNPAELSQAEEEIAAVAELAEQFKREAILPTNGSARLRLEAVIISDGSRPAGLVKNGQLLASAAMGEFGELYELDPAPFDAAFAATGRISDGRRIVGGGILVRLEIDGQPVDGILTARHVAQDIATDPRALTLSATAEIDFNGELGGGAPNRHALAEVLASGPDFIATDSRLDAWDFALIRLGDPLEGHPRPAPATMDLLPDLVALNRPAAIVSFPGQPPLRPTEQMPGTIWHQLFAGLWNVKRLSPAQLIPPPAGQPEFEGLADRVVLHDGTTTGGSSGGSLLGVGSGQLAGIHVGGRAATANVALRLHKVADLCGWGVAA